jgi:glutamate racemase
MEGKTLNTHRLTVGVFDSGVGGLSVLREIRALLPGVDLVYVADSAHVPYGEKPPTYIEARSLRLAQFLAEQGADAIVVACNTATAAAMKALRQQFSIPIVGMEPAVKPAMAATRSGVVGVLATTGTLASSRFAALLERYQGGNAVITEPCPGWVEAVERGELTGKETQILVERHVLPLVAKAADVLILGCTHYAFLRALVDACAGPGVTVIDTGAAVARQLKHKLADTGLLTGEHNAGAEAFYTSGDPVHSRHVTGKLWGETLLVRALPAEYA